ncbi:MAG: Fe-S cluster assembly sulfur transfer protein SufU [archaeon]
MKKEIYTEIILDLYRNPVNRGKLEGADVEAQGGNPTCGDNVYFTMKIGEGKIQDIKFLGSGCAISTAAESLLTEMVKGKSIKHAKKISGEQLLGELGGIIQTRMKCALLGLNVLKKGLEAYEKSGGKKTIVKGIII